MRFIRQAMGEQYGCGYGQGLLKFIQQIKIEGNKIREVVKLIYNKVWAERLMPSNNTYILQLIVRKCRINVQESGSVGLLLRAGKNQSHVTQLQPIINGVVNFNTSIKLNVDESALDTKRCTLTLNFVSTSNVKKVIGIVVITIPEVGAQIERTIKVTSTPDKDAEIELSLGLRQMQLRQEIQDEPKQLKPLATKQSQKSKPSNRSDNNVIFGDLFGGWYGKIQQRSRFPENQNNQKLKIKSKHSDVQSMSELTLNEDSLNTIMRLQKQKELLKELLKLEMAKSNAACSHLKNILDLLQTAVGVGILSSDTVRMAVTGTQSVTGKKPDGIGLGRNSLSPGSPTLTVVKESSFEEFSQSRSRNLSKSKEPILGYSRKPDVAQILSQLRGRIEQAGRTKSELAQMFQKIKAEPTIQIDAAKLRVLKTRIEKVYIPLIIKDTISKQEILRQKIQINKILDQVVCPLVK